MKIAQVPKNEQHSLKAQHEYYTPNASTDVDFEDIARIASHICHTPALLVFHINSAGCLFRSLTPPAGMVLPGFPLITDGSDKVFVVPDLSRDKRFHDHPLVIGKPYALFYAGVPLVSTEDGVRSTLCIMNDVPGKLDKEQLAALQALGRQVSLQIAAKAQAEKQAARKIAADDLAKIAHLASHDLKSPLNNIISLTHLLKEDYGSHFDDEGNEYINYLNDAAYQLSDLCTGILNYARSSTMVIETREDIEINGLANEVIGMLNIPAHVTINYHRTDSSIHTSRPALKQLLMHLLQNGIKYLDTEPVTINLNVNENSSSFFFEVSDNNNSIPREEKEKIIALFAAGAGPKEVYNMGIDLAIAKRFADRLGGSLAVSADISEGMSFTVSIPKMGK